MWSLQTERGRQWWEYDASIPDTISKAAESVTSMVKAAREAYSASRYVARHSSDRLLRAQAAAGLIEGNPYKGQLVPVPKALEDEDKSRDNEISGTTNGAKAGHETKESLESTQIPGVAKSLHRGIAYYATLQMGDGHWAGDYGGPMFLMPGLLIACHITRTDLGRERKSEMMRYLRNHQNEDGGFGLHIEHHSTMFGTALNYVSMRILGAEADDPDCVSARAWIEANGGAGGIPGWGKFWLSVMGVYDWEGVDPLTPEFWLLPYALPVHPARFWCHCRVVYLPMSHLYGRRAVGPIDSLVLQLREELYGQPYKDVDWAAQRGRCCPVDVYSKRPKLQRVLWEGLVLFEKIWFPGKQALRNWALEETLELVANEDENTNFIDIGPVNKTINFLCRWFDDPQSPAVAKHIDRLKDYLWLAEDGMKMQGYNGSQLWDTAFSAIALTTVGKEIMEPFTETLTLAHDYVDISQVQVDVPNRERYYRHQSKGAWPFSTVDHGWPIADCTGEGLKAALALESATWVPKRSEISRSRLEDACDMIISYQNPNGGWATYELTRGPEWLELMNPSEIFGNIMIDYCYCECSASAVTGLIEFRKQYPDYRSKEVERAIESGIAYIKSVQKPDGSWYGSWGVCFLYGAVFSVDALVRYGETAATSPVLDKACRFVLSVQKDDGSWGESYMSSQDHVYTQSDEGHVVSTAWAVLVLTQAKWPDQLPIARGVRFLMASQEENGDWPQQSISGVFNHNCMISYSEYRNIFPIWALAECRHYLRDSPLTNGIGPN